MSDTLEHIARTTSTSLDLDEVLGPVLRDLAEGVGIARATLTLLDRSGTELRLEAAHGLTPSETRRLHYAVGEGITGRVAETGIPAQVQVAEEPAFVDNLGIRQRYPRAVFACAPVTHDGRTLGVLSGFGFSGQVDAQALGVAAALLAPAVHSRVQQRQEAPSSSGRPQNVVGSSKPMRRVYEAIHQVGPSNTTVLLRGESGTGKELVAQAVHAESPRSRGPFVKVNCAALSEGVLESELFGHEKGAFTGAIRERAGRFERAHGGTLFLDEIGDLAPQTQIKLLRVLQEREFERVGGDRTLHVDVRVVAATSRDLEAMMDAGSFRSDLYYRLNVFPIRLPSLRERRADITQLADHFVEQFNVAHGRRVRRVSTSAIDMLMAYHWPGNVRELENCIERAVLVARDDVLLGHHLPPTLQTAEASGTRAGGLEEQLQAVERELVLDALKSSRGNVAAAARELGVTERILGLRVVKYAIEPRRFKVR